MKQNKGFTLIELLAVIVILAVIALIVTPVITNIIKGSKDSSDLRSAEAYAKAGENYYAESTLTNSTLDANVIDDIEVSGKKATGSVIVSSSGGVEMAIVIDDKCYWKGYGDSVQDIVVSDDVSTCNITTIYDTVISAFPELALGTNGCNVSNSSKNYSYMGGCYLKGTQTKNYLWYSGFLWRIVGINQDKTIKLITEENVSDVSYNNTHNSEYDGSYIDNWLNDYFYNKLKGNSIITTNSFCEHDLSNDDISTTCDGEISLSRKVGLMTYNEVYFSYNSKTSYLVNSQYYWTMTPNKKYTDMAFLWMSDGCLEALTVTAKSGVRPVINVSPSASITGGDGTISTSWTDTSSPYILSEQKNSDTTGNLYEKATVGEYVKFADKTYRVAAKDSDGNIKLILDGYYQATAGTNTAIAFGTDSTFTTSSGIGQTLNSTILDWLVPSTDTTNRSKLVTDYTWYQVTDDNYNLSLSDSKVAVNSTVGLIREGEILAGQSYTTMSNLDYYWTLSRWKVDNTNVVLVYNGDDGNVTNNYAASTALKAVRPVIVVNNSTAITSGTGTLSSPYNI